MNETISSLEMDMAKKNVNQNLNKRRVVHNLQQNVQEVGNP
jgi:hypothetical protein